MDQINETRNPIYDANATKLNEALNDTYIKMPGFIVPLEMGSSGVTEFILVPYVGACIHTPPPPPNQLVFVTTKEPWPNDLLWDAVWVAGKIATKLYATDLGQTGYTLIADEIEVYVW